jgi:hypothetical protein
MTREMEDAYVALTVWPDTHLATDAAVRRAILAGSTTRCYSPRTTLTGRTIR